jgi:hypothetical protein
MYINWSELPRQMREEASRWYVEIEIDHSVIPPNLCERFEAWVQADPRQLRGLHLGQALQRARRASDASRFRTSNEKAELARQGDCA